MTAFQIAPYAAFFAKHGDIDARAAQYAARHYLHYRRRHGMNPLAAVRAASALPNAYVPNIGYYGPTGAVGAEKDGLRWVESVSAIGLRFVGDACDLMRNYRYARDIVTEYLTDPDGYGCGTRLRAGVWQVPGRDGKARLVAGYREMEGGQELNPGSARIDFSRVFTGDEDDAKCEAARAADGIADSAADDERDYQRTYQDGREAADAHNMAIAARRELLAILPAIRKAKPNGGALVDMAMRRVRELLETISTMREARDGKWSACPSCDESAWLYGFTDETEATLADIVRLGWRKAGQAL